jgi:hypothetical protein
MSSITRAPILIKRSRIVANSAVASGSVFGIAARTFEGEAGDAGHESVKACDVVTLTRQQHEANQVAERIDERRNFGGQTAARFADSLIASPPFAPVPCWWTRMCVASRRTYSRSGSSDSILKMRSHTPFRAQRQKRV